MRKIAVIIACATMTATAGCANLNNFNKRFGLPVAPMTDSRPELEAWTAELDNVGAALRRYDLTRNPRGLPTNRSYLVRTATGEPTEHTISDSTYAPYLENYVRARQDQIDGLCSVFFNDLQGLSSTSRWGRDQFNAVAEFSSLMLGLGGAASKQLAALSGTQILFNDSYDAASAALLISADPYRVYRAVAAAQTEYAARNAGPITNFRQAETIVRGYAEPCTLMGVQRLIAEALDTQFRGESEGGTGLAIRLSSLVSTLNAVDAAGAGQLAQTDLTEETLAVMFWILKLGPTDEERAAALAKLPAVMRSRMQALLADTGSPLRPTLVAQIDQIDRLSPSVGRDARKLQTDVRDAAAAKVEADAVAAATAEEQAAKSNPSDPPVEGGVAGEDAAEGEPGNVP